MINKLKILVNILSFLFIITSPIIDVKAANDYYQPLSSGDKALFKEMFKPLFNFISLIPYAASVAAIFYILYAGFNMVTAGYDSAKKEQSKTMIALTIIGLGVVWAAPLFIDYLLA